MDWKNASMDDIVCYCKSVRMKEITRAIGEGARTLDDIKERTGACTGEICAELNPSGKCCAGDIQEILDIYVPVYESLSGGCG